MDVTLMRTLAGLIGAICGAGGAWGATRQRIVQLETTREAVETELEKHDQRTRTFAEGLARMEEKLKRLDVIETKLDRVLGGRHGD